MYPYQIHKGGASAMGQTTASISASDVDAALRARGYVVGDEVPIEPYVPPGRTLTKAMAISVSIDEAIVRCALPHTQNHPYMCPSWQRSYQPTRCFIDESTWDSIVTWCVTVASGYLAAHYALPGWAQAALDAGTLTGAFGHLGGFGDWLNENPWFVKSVGDTITNYGEHLTAQNVQAAIKANTAQQLSKDDAIALVAALQQGGYVPPGKGQTVAEGANLAAQPSWVMPALIGGGVLLALMLMKK